MKSSWNEKEAAIHGADPLAQRVYTSRLIGKEPYLVLHGGGNTSVKAKAKNVFGDNEEIVYVKRTGYDLATITADGFAPLKLDIVKRMVTLDELSDADMMRLLRSATGEPEATPPSVEAILHAIVPFKFVDHTHADAVVTITNTEKGTERIGQIYGDRMFLVPYVMPGFLLAKEIYEMTRDIDWQQVEGMILLNHGVFTFGDDARSSYERMIQIVTVAEDYLQKRAAVEDSGQASPKEDLRGLARLRRAVSNARGRAVVAKVDADPAAVHFSGLLNVESIASRGPLTPNHVMHAKRVPLIVESSPEEDVARYAREYQDYFDRNTDGELTCLDPAPRWAIWPEHGAVSFGHNYVESGIISDIAKHTIRAIQLGEGLGGWQPLPEDHVFDVEYWELERVKMPALESLPPLCGKVALVTGAASGIGRACVRALNAQGAAVMALDIDPKITGTFEKKDIWGLVCDVTDGDSVKTSVQSAVRRFGGLDILVSNAGTFPATETIAEMKAETWSRSIDLNLSSHQRVLQECIPYLELGVDAAVVIIASKNVAAPGPGAAAYSAAKAGLTQLARVAALELAPKRVRVNIIHPDAVFDTGIWTPEVLESRARHYGMGVDAYKTKNLLGVEVESKDVAALACAMAGPLFSKTTGAQVPVDGGNDRVV